jgi:hypothetical protein
MNPYPYNQYAPPQPPPPAGYGYGPQPGGTQEDEQNLNVLSICHFIYAGLFGLVSLVFGTILVVTMLATAGAAAHGKGGPEAAAVIGIADVILGVFVVFFLAKTTLLAYSGACIRRRRNRTLSMVMACLACLNVPLGTALGVFTLVVLSRPSVKAMYDYAERFGVPAHAPR